MMKFGFNQKIQQFDVIVSIKFYLNFNINRQIYEEIYDETDMAGSHNLEWANPILGLCYGVSRTGLFLDTY